MSKTPVRMLHVIPWPTWGGPHTEVIALHRFGGQHGWSIFVVIPPDAADVYDRLNKEGVRVVRRPLVRLRKTMSPAFWAMFPWRY